MHVTVLKVFAFHTNIKELLHFKGLPEYVSINYFLYAVINPTLTSVTFFLPSNKYDSYSSCLKVVMILFLSLNSQVDSLKAGHGQ